MNLWHGKVHCLPFRVQPSNSQLVGYKIKPLISTCHYKSVQPTDTFYSQQLLVEYNAANFVEKIPFEHQNLNSLTFQMYITVRCLHPTLVFSGVIRKASFLVLTQWPIPSFVLDKTQNQLTDNVEKESNKVWIT